MAIICVLPANRGRIIPDADTCRGILKGQIGILEKQTHFRIIRLGNGF